MGGAYNPIIPAFARTPKKWEPHSVRLLPKPSDILKGYLDGFDPDLVVTVGTCGRRNVDVGHRDLITVDELLGDVNEGSAPRFGVGFIDVLRGLLSDEFKYQRNDDLRLVFPKFPRADRLFFASVFGALPKEAERLIDEQLPESVPIVRPAVTLGTYPDFLESRNLFPRRIGTQALDVMPLHSPTLFLLDATNGLDIIDFWNLRAAGHYVVPIAIQAAGQETSKNFARRFIDMNFGPYRDNPNIYHDTTVQKARSLSEEDVRAFCNSLGIERPKDANRHKFSIRGWYPRLWDEWARDRSWSEGIRFPYSHEVEKRISDGDKQLDLRSEDPHFKLAQEYSGQPRFTNEFHFRFYGSKEPMAEVIPEGSRKLSKAIGRTGYRNWRFSRRGLVFLAHNPKDLIFIDIPNAESVMTEWLRERGWQVALSAPGRMALQLYRQLGGAWGISWLAHKGVIPLLGDLEKEVGLSWAAVMGRLQRIIDVEELLFQKERFLEGLMETNALRLGASIQCSVCTRHNWYEMDKLKYQLQCKFCLSEFEPPLKSPKDIDWTYRAHGPYASSSSQGAFSVLLTLKFLAARDNGRITPLFSYTATKDGKQLESDLTCLYKASDRRDSRTHVLHAECKSFGGFEARDFNRMEQLSRDFPGAALVFSTLLDTLDEYSARRLQAIALKHRRNRVSRKPYSPVIVLTATELFSWGAPECWEDLPIYKEVDRAALNESLLNVLADATQRLYLTMPSWHDWSEQEWAKRQKRRSQSSQIEPASSPAA